jgi:hypothetical protein
MIPFSTPEQIKLLTDNGYMKNSWEDKNQPFAKFSDTMYVEYTKRVRLDENSGISIHITLTHDLIDKHWKHNETYVELSIDSNYAKLNIVAYPQLEALENLLK